MPRALPDVILEEVLCRLPPHEPKVLVRAALVSRRWCRLVSNPGFRRRFREFHHRPPMLGMLCNDYTGPSSTVRFVPTTAFCTPRKTLWDMNILDARHSRVLLISSYSLVLWDPIADKVRNLPFPLKQRICAAAVLCSAAGCNHLDCHQGPFLAVLLCSNGVVYTYSSDAAAWSESVCAEQKYSIEGFCMSNALMGNFCMSNALVGNSLYFKNGLGCILLKFDLDLRQVSFVLPPSLPGLTLWKSMLATMDDGGLGLIYIDDSKLYMWSRKEIPEVDAKWESRVIELKPLFPEDVDVTKLIGVTGSGDGIIFMRTEFEVYSMDLKTNEAEFEVYSIDLKTNEVKKVCKVTSEKFIPYMSFYTPALELRNQVQAGGSSA